MVQVVSGISNRTNFCASGVIIAARAASVFARGLQPPSRARQRSADGEGRGLCELRRINLLKLLLHPGANDIAIVRSASGASAGHEPAELVLFDVSSSRTPRVPVRRPTAIPAGFPFRGYIPVH